MTGFWLEHKAQLRGYIMKRVRDTDVVDDILQEVYIKAFTKLSTLKSKGNISGWLFRIASNAIADHYRSQKPWADLQEEYVVPDPERSCATELAPCVQPFIAELPKIYQAALMLSEIDGLAQKEVTNRLGISLTAAKSRIQRGRVKLRQRYLECCNIEISRYGIVDYEPRNK